MDMRPRMELRQELLNEISLEHLPPEYKAKELRETIDLMRRVAKYDLVDLANKDKILAKEMLDSKIEWNESWKSPWDSEDDDYGYDHNNR